MKPHNFSMQEHDECLEGFAECCDMVARATGEDFIAIALAPIAEGLRNMKFAEEVREPAPPRHDENGNSVH